MLSYTRNFVCKPSPSDNTDLDLEFVLLAIGGQAPLFVNLNTIIVNANACRRLADTNTLSMIASSSIERIVYGYLTPQDEKSVLLLHNNLRTRNAPVTSVEVLEGHRVSPFIAPRLLYTAAPGISLNLHSLITASDRNSLPLWYLALSNAPNLTDLRIVSKAPSGSATAPDPKLIGEEKIRFEKLQRLEVHASGREDVFSYLDCPSLHSFSLQLAYVAGLSTIFTSLASFERMESLSITITEKNPILGFEDLRPVLCSLVSLRDFTIRGVTAQLAEDDIVKILTMRPLIRTLVISGPRSTLLPLSTLFSIPQPQPSLLETICLPIDFTSIASLQTPPVWPMITSLKCFIVWDGNRIPHTMRDKLKFVDFVLRMFPCARIDSIGDDHRGMEERGSVKDLEELRYYISRSAKGLSVE